MIGWVILWIFVALAVIAGIGAAAEAISNQRTDAGKEWRRACQHCQAVWFVDASAAREKAPTQADMVSAKMYRAGKRASLFTTRGSAAEMAVHNLEAKGERVRSLNACPSCGSQSFAQQLVPVQY